MTRMHLRIVLCTNQVQRDKLMNCSIYFFCRDLLHFVGGIGLSPSETAKLFSRCHTWNELHMWGQNHWRLLCRSRGGLSTFPCVRPSLRIRGKLHEKFKICCFSLGPRTTWFKSIGIESRKKSLLRLVLGRNKWFSHCMHCIALLHFTSNSPPISRS